MSAPNFLVIGAAKAGTTSLRLYLDQHPEIFVARRGEPSYFAHVDGPPTETGPGDSEWSFVTRSEDYARLFDEAEEFKAVGEISPRYLFYPSAAEAIGRMLPEARLIVILRHPVDRAYSHYLMNVQRGVEDAPDLTEAIEREGQRASDGWGWDWQYTGLGQYCRQLERYRPFLAAGRIAVHDYQQYRDNPAAFFEAVFSFLGVDPTFRPDTGQRRRQAEALRSPVLRRLTGRHGPLRSFAGMLPSSLRAPLSQRLRSMNTKAPPRLDPEIRRRLFDRYFAEDQARLADMLAEHPVGLRQGVPA